MKPALIILCSTVPLVFVLMFISIMYGHKFTPEGTKMIDGVLSTLVGGILTILGTLITKNKK